MRPNPRWARSSGARLGFNTIGLNRSEKRIKILNTKADLCLCVHAWRTRVAKKKERQ